MTKADTPLPDDLEALKALIRQQQAQLAQRDTKIATLQEQLNLLIAKRYGRSSEKADGQQLWLFNEAEAAVVETPGEETEAQGVSIPAHPRKKPGRKPLPEYITRVEVLHDLADEEKVCPHDGTPLERIGEEVSEQLDVIPAKVQVLRHIRPKYACPCCREGVKTAPLPPQPIPRSIASPALLAHVVTAKYADALPLYRQEEILRRAGVDIPRATLAGWVLKLGVLVQPLINLLRDTLLEQPYIQMDETTVQVLKEKGRPASSQSYMWVQRAGPPGRHIILYDYNPSRGAAVPVRLLDGFRGYLQTDGYEGYNAVAVQEGVTQVGCWAHARRKFDEALKAQGKKGKARAGRAAQGLELIGALYHIEQVAREETRDQPPERLFERRLQRRREQAMVQLERLRQWLDESLPEVPPQSATGKALHYLAGQWPKLVRYVEDGRIDIDNNAAERAIRPFVIGRNNWLFSDSVKGAEASACLYSLITTARANGHEPYRYLCHVFKELPLATSVEQFEALLPFNIEPATLR